MSQISPDIRLESPETRPESRPRINRTACGTCHRRKVKCDGQTVGLPCTNCRRHMRSDCTWHMKRRRLPDASIRSPNQVISIAPARSENAALQETIAEDSASSGYALIDDISQGCKTHLVEFIDQENLSYRPIDKAARITYVGTDTSNINFLVRQSVQRPVVHHFPTNRIDRRFTAYEPDRLPVEALQLPEKHIVDELLQAYFEKVNPGFPVVDQDRFMAQYAARDATDPPSLLLLQSILLVGAHAVPHRAPLKSSFFRRAKILIDSRFERNRDTIVQAALLLTWHSDGPEDVAANAWHWVGYAARVAIGLGMHRDADTSTLVEHNKKMWRRVWWLLVQCDLLIALQYGRPFAVNLEDCDVQPPKPSDYDECGAGTQVDYAIAITDLCLILRTAYRKCFNPSAAARSRHENLGEADEELARWCLLLPQHLRLRPTLSLDLWPASLHLIYNTALILLHRPRPQTPNSPSPSSQPTANDAEICSAAAGVVQSIFESLRERQYLSSLWVFSITALFTAMIQLNVEVRFANPLLAVAAVQRYDSTLYSLRKLSEHWPNAESILHYFETSESLKRQHGSDTGSRYGPHEPSSPLRSPMLASGERIEYPSAQEDPQTSANLRQLFPFNNSFDSIGTHNATYLEGWAEMYWQEPFTFNPTFGI